MRFLEVGKNLCWEDRTAGRDYQGGRELVHGMVTERNEGRGLEEAQTTQGRVT